MRGIWSRLLQWVNSLSHLWIVLIAFAALLLAIVGLFAHDTQWAAVVLGFVLALIGNWAIEGFKLWQKRRDDAKFTAKAYERLSWEIAQGVGRCEHLVHLRAQGEVSYSHVIVEVWNLVKERLFTSVGESEIIGPLSRIYHRFDLINFNMDRGMFGAGGAMADTHIHEIRQDFDEFCRLSGLSNRIELQVPEERERV